MKRIIYLVFALTIMMLIPKTVLADDVSIYYGSNYITSFPDNYSFDDTSKNKASTSLGGTIGYYWVDINNNNVEPILNQLYDNCGESEEDTTQACNSTLTTLADVLPPEPSGEFIANNFTSDKIKTSGTWLLWAQVNKQNENAKVYRTWHIYEITIPEEPDAEPTPATEDSTPTSTPTTTTTTTYNTNVNTGVSNIAFVVVPIILAVGVYITLRKNKYNTED